MVHLNSLRINMKKKLIFERLKCFRGPYTALLCHWTCRLNGAAGSANMNHAEPLQTVWSVQPLIRRQWENQGQNATITPNSSPRKICYIILIKLCNK